MSRLEALRRHPASGFTQRHRRQQQRQQEQDVIEADPDMPDAFDEVLAELRQARGFAGGKALRRPLRREHRRLRGAIETQAKEAAMQSIEVEQQAIVELQFAHAGRAAPGQPEHRIGAVGMVVDQVVGNLDFAGAATVQRQAAKRPGIYRAVTGAQLAPGDLTIAIGIKAQREIDVAQGNVPLAGDFPALYVEHQITVAGLVRLGRLCDQQHQRAEPVTQPHRRITSADSSPSLRSSASSKPLDCNQSRTGWAAATSPAAIAASSRMRASRGSRCTR